MLIAPMTVARSLPTVEYLEEAGMSFRVRTPHNKDTVTHETVQYHLEFLRKERAAAFAAPQEDMSKTLTRILDDRMETALLRMAEIVDHGLDGHSNIVKEHLRTLKTRTEGSIPSCILKSI